MRDYKISRKGQREIILPESVPVGFTINIKCGRKKVKIKVPAHQTIPVPPKTTIDPYEGLQKE